jgi:hypothetical protein
MKKKKQEGAAQSSPSTLWDLQRLLSILVVVLGRISEDPIGEDLEEEDLQTLSDKSGQEHFYVQNCIFRTSTNQKSLESTHH